MKILATSLTLAILLSLATAILLGDVIGPVGCFFVSFLIGLGARPLTEKLLGYTIYEELSGKYETKK